MGRAHLAPADALWSHRSPEPMTHFPFTKEQKAYAAVVGAYVAAGLIAVELGFINKAVPPIWPSAGIALGALVMLGYRLWPAILVGAFLLRLALTVRGW